MLTTEQEDALRKVGEAVGVDLLALVGEAEDATKYLEELGIAHKNHKPEGFWAQFRKATSRKPERTKVAAKPALPGLIDRALRADAAPGMVKDFAAQTNIGRKANEDIEERVIAKLDANGFTEQLAAIVELARSFGPQLEAISKRLDDNEHRTDNLEESGKVRAEFPWLDLGPRPTIRYDIDLNPGGNSHKAPKPFNWALFADTFGGGRA